jgi:hypothetical protein
MTVGKISALCWTAFVVMCVAFMPLAIGLNRVHVPTALMIAAVVVVWWGPFAYAMYLGMVAIRNGDRRLLRRGIRGTALVLSAKATNTRISKGEYDWQAPLVYKYRLRVSVPGRDPYETVCSICVRGIAEGSTVDVAVSRHNHKRVTIDVGQAEPGGTAARVTFQATPRSEDDRIDRLARLGRLHSDGVLTDAEFAAEKARILGSRD